MPELPEVETTRRGLSPLLSGKVVQQVRVRETRLRQPVPRNLARTLEGLRLEAIERRAKYLLFRFETGVLIAHLGMSGSLRVVTRGTAYKKHDHVEFDLGKHRCLRFHDPRRFGLLLWTEDSVADHALIAHLGPEPWDPTFNGDYLYETSRKRGAAVKNFLMDGRIVVGVGNIYASESLFRAGVDPRRAAGRVSQVRYERICGAVREVLEEALTVGGTTLRDFVNSDGEPGYFRLQLNVYGRAGDTCRCGRAQIRSVVIGQRSSFYCPRCQR